MQSQNRLAEGVALITGGSRGIGFEIAKAFAQQGCHTALVARSAERLEQAQERLLSFDINVKTYATDLNSEKDLGGLADRVVKDMGGLRFLINSAGIFVRDPLGKVDPIKWEQTMQLNLLSVMHLSRVAVPHLKQDPHAAIINIGSTAGKKTFPTGSAYCASKWGLLGFAGSLFDEIKGQGIKVSTICPGFVATDMTADEGLDPSKMIQPQDIAQTAVFVANFPSTGCPTEIVIRQQC